MKKNIKILQTSHLEDQLVAQLVELGLAVSNAAKIARKVFYYLATLPQLKAWQKIVEKILIHQTCFAVHKLLYTVVYPDYDKIPRPVWFPKKNFIKQTHIAKLMHQLTFDQCAVFQRWSRTHYADFWNLMITKLRIIFDKPYEKTIDITAGIESPQWFKGSLLNIANSCFNAKKIL